jgi:signal transduction histidine kinase
LYIVKGAIGMMQSGKLTQEQTREYTEMIRQNITAMEKLINHLLNGEQPGGVMRASPEPVAVNELLCKVIENVTPLAASRQVDLLHDIQRDTIPRDIIPRVINPRDSIPGFLQAFCDPEMLERVLYNLMTNAIKYTGANGVVYLCAEKSGADIRVTISDTGCGLTDEQLGQLYGGTDQAVGDGYGLRLVKAMMAAMDGQLECKSQRDMGTTFYLYLPKKERLPAAQNE